MRSNSQDGPVRSWSDSLWRMLKQRLGEAAALESGRTWLLTEPHSWLADLAQRNRTESPSHVASEHACPAAAPSEVPGGIRKARGRPQKGQGVPLAVEAELPQYMPVGIQSVELTAHRQAPSAV